MHCLVVRVHHQLIKCMSNRLDKRNNEGPPRKGRIPNWSEGTGQSIRCHLKVTPGSIGEGILCA